MNAIILAGGFGTRMLPLTLSIPKALLPVAGKPVIDYQMEQLALVNEIDQIIISTNIYFQNKFHNWWLDLPLSIQKKTTLKIEPSNGEPEKLGSVRGLSYVIDTHHFNKSDWLVIAGDNLFEFQLTDFVKFYQQHQSASVAFYETEETKQRHEKYGFGILGQDGRLLEFIEKPDNPLSRLISTGCYIFPASMTAYLHEYIDTMHRHDQMGNFIGWLRTRCNIYGFVFKDKWHDIGSHDSYEDANNYYLSKILDTEQS